MIRANKAIYNLFGFCIYHKHHYISKLKYYGFHKGNIGLFSANDISIAGYFIVIPRDTRMIKAHFTTVYSSEFNSMVLDSKLSKEV